MYGRIYTVRLTPTACSAVLDALEIAPATNKPIVVHKVVLAPTQSETNQQIQVTVRTLGATSTSGSTGATAPTISGKSSVDPAAGFTVENFNTTVATTAGTTYYHADEAFPSQGGFEYLPDVTERPIVRAGELFIVRIEETAGGAIMGGHAIVEEI